MNVECMLIYLIYPGVKGEYLVLNAPIHITQNPKFFCFCQISSISSISGTFGSLTPMGEHPWVIELNILSLIPLVLLKTTVLYINVGIFNTHNNPLMSLIKIVV